MLIDRVFGFRALGCAGAGDASAPGNEGDRAVGFLRRNELHDINIQSVAHRQELFDLERHQSVFNLGKG